MSNFHYAFKVKDLESTRRFYGDILKCKEGRSTSTWLDFDFYGNQLSAHISESLPEADYCGMVDGVRVPIPHFGCLLSREEFMVVEERLEKADVHFIIKPQTRYEGQSGEQRTMFVLDFSGNPLEFKSFTRQGEVFSKSSEV